MRGRAFCLQGRTKERILFGLRKRKVVKNGENNTENILYYLPSEWLIYRKKSVGFAWQDATGFVRDHMSQIRLNPSDTNVNIQNEGGALSLGIYAQGHRSSFQASAGL